MKLPVTIISVLLGMSLVAAAGSNDATTGSALRLLLSEVQPGVLGSEQHCMLVFDDHHFHAELARRKRGKDEDRKVYQGQLSDAEWNALNAILDSKQFRELQVPRSMQALVVQDPHPYTISVSREGGFQNMEFLTKESLKPYESQLKPLLQWWKSSRNFHSDQSNAAVDSRCSLSDTNGIFND